LRGKFLPISWHLTLIEAKKSFSCGFREIRFMKKEPNMNVLLRLPDVKKATGLSRSTLYCRIKQGLLPPPVKLGIRSAAWPKTEVAAINAARIAGKSETEIRQLVTSLMEIRIKTA
jgi:prophage regulatory protein